MVAELKVIQYQPDCFAATWVGLGKDEAGAKADIPISSSSRTCQVVVTEGTKINVSADLEGSMDGENWSVLMDSLGAPLQGKLVDAIFDILQCTRYVRPKIIGGDDTTRANVYILAG